MRVADHDIDTKARAVGVVRELVERGMPVSAAGRMVADLLGVSPDDVAEWHLRRSADQNGATAQVPDVGTLRRLPSISWSGSAEVLMQGLDAMTEGSLITDAVGMILHANPAFTEITGYTAAEVLGQDCSFLQGQGTDPATVRRIRVALNGGEGFRGDILNYRKDGERFWNSLIIVPVRGSNGQVSHFVSVQRDIRDDIDHLMNVERRLYEAEARSETEELLRELSASVLARSSTPDQYQSLAEALLAVTGADCAVFALSDSRSGEVVIGGVGGKPRQRHALGDVIDVPEPAAAPDDEGRILTRDDASEWLALELVQTGSEALICVPILSAGGRRGYLIGYWEAGVPMGVSRSLVQERARRVGLLASAAVQ